MFKLAYIRVWLWPVLSNLPVCKLGAVSSEESLCSASSPTLGLRLLFCVLGVPVQESIMASMNCGAPFSYLLNSFFRL